ncbi:MAG: hypothetical protein QOJ35_1562 [Solirubrobacteraceae bacterium]|jgi:uncharacterized protein (DUF58 family)|nr:hypothetical protein [Solirubrobacteraceae bacterium]
MRRALATGMLGLVLSFAAALVDAEPLWIPGLTLVLLAAGSAAWVALAAGGVTVRRTLGATRVVEGEPLGIVLEVNVAGLALPAARMRDPLLAEPAPLPAGRGARVRIEVRFARRGRRRLELSSVLVADPLGLATREVRALPSARDDEVLVLPRIELLESTAGGGDATHLALHARRLVGAEVQLDGIRPLRDGTPASRIFWPAIARGADPQERYLRADGEGQPLVVLDPRGAADEERLDDAVRAATSIAHALAIDGGCGVLLPGDRRPTELTGALSGWSQVHARLATVGSGGAPSLVSVAHRRGPVVYVSARLRPALPLALGSGHGATRMLVVPGALAGRAAVFSVAGCTAYVVGGRRVPASRRNAVGGRP